MSQIDERKIIVEFIDERKSLKAEWLTVCSFSFFFFLVQLHIEHGILTMRFCFYLYVCLRVMICVDIVLFDYWTFCISFHRFNRYYRYATIYLYRSVTCLMLQCFCWFRHDVFKMLHDFKVELNWLACNICMK